MPLKITGSWINCYLKIFNRQVALPIMSGRFNNTALSRSKLAASVETAQSVFPCLATLDEIFS